MHMFKHVCSFANESDWAVTRPARPAPGGRGTRSRYIGMAVPWRQPAQPTALSPVQLLRSALVAV